MAIPGTKKVMPSIKKDTPVSDQTSRKEGVPFHSFFNSSRVQTPGKSITSVLERPASNVRSVPKVDPQAVQRWVALEEKIIQVRQTWSAPKPQGEKKIMSSGNISPVVAKPVVAKSKTSFLNFFNAAKPKTPSVSASVIPATPPASTASAGTPKVAPKSVERWVALEERIIHTHRVERTSKPVEVKGTASRPVEKKLPKIRIVDSTGKDVPRGKGGFSWAFPLFSKGGSSHTKKAGGLPTTSTDPVPPKVSGDLPRTDRVVVKDWLVREERTISAQPRSPRAFPSGMPVFSPPTAPKPLFPDAEDLKAKPAAALLSPVPGREAARRPRRTFLGLGRFLLVLGWLAMGAVTFFYFREMVLNLESQHRFSRLQNEKRRLERFYALLQTTSEDQGVQISWLQNQLKDANWELKNARSQIHTLRDSVRTQKDIIKALKAQAEALEKVIAQAQTSAVSSAAAGVSSQQFPPRDSFSMPATITSINEQQGFIVINSGASQGVYSGQWILIARAGQKLAIARIDRVYPTMSTATFHDRRAVGMVHEGDNVIFS